MKIKKRFRTLAALLLTTLLCTGVPWPTASYVSSPTVGMALAADDGKREGEPTTPETAHLPTPAEVKMGREGSAEAEKQYKIVKEGPHVDRVRRISETVLGASDAPELAQAYLEANKLPKRGDDSRRVAFQFTFKVADSDEVNAFSFAGGPIFITTGLLDYVQSDHELAAVIAHEIAHVRHHHLRDLIQKQAKAERKMMWALLAGLLSGAAGSQDFGNLMLGAQIYMIAKQFGYGRDAERDADRTALQYLRRTEYSPIGMLTVMKRFARDESRRGTDLGIFQSHPYSKERAELIEGHLKQAGIEVDRGTEREIANRFRLETRSAQASGRDTAELVLNGELMFRAATGEGRSPMERVRAIQKQLEELLEQNLSVGDCRLSKDQTQVLARGRALLTVYPADAEAHELTIPQTSKAALDVLLKALWSEQLDLTF